MLTYFAAIKQKEIDDLQKIKFFTPWAETRAGFTDAILARAATHGIACIAEYKRASPALGDINLALQPQDIASIYSAAGAAAISVLTEPTRFKGNMEYLHSIHTKTPTVPLLRKDFIMHSLQIQHTASTPASALLLIAELTPKAALLRSLREEAEQFGMEAVVEVFEEHSLALAQESGARIIQVNARNLNTMQVDRTHPLRLAQKYRHTTGEVWIAASGISSKEHIQEACSAGFDAVLIGSGLMQHSTPGQALQALTSPLYQKKHA